MATKTEQKEYKSPLRWAGGKQRALNQIFELFPHSAYEYREPFVGGGSIYLKARSNNFAECYWINDKFQELISFWRAMQHPAHCQAVQAALRATRILNQTAEELKEFFHSVKDEKSAGFLREAFLFYFFNRVTFSGTTLAGGFSKSAALDRFTESSIERLSILPEALQGVTITNLDFAQVIQEPGTDVFLVIDAPYFQAKKLYGRGGELHFSFQDHSRLATCLANTEHKFLATYDDCPEIRALYDWAHIRTWSLQYGMNNCGAGNKSRKGAELFISNY